MSDQPQKSVVHQSTDDAGESPASIGRTIPPGDKFDPDNAAKATGQADPHRRPQHSNTEADRNAREQDESDYGGPLDLDQLNPEPGE
jgi:hypothetical protein